MDAVYAGITRRQPLRPTHSEWLKSLGAERQRRSWSAADAVMTVSVIVALLCMCGWFLVLADQHAMLEWYFD
jgi:hypothetical protein